MSDPADLQRLIGDVIRTGIVASIDHANATCIVRIGNLLTDEVPWLAFRAGGTAAWSPPTIGEQCLLLCPEGDTAAGVVLLGLYSDANPAPAAAEDVELLRFVDGAEISYDAAAHRLVAKLPAGGRAEIEAPDGITLVGPVEIWGTLSVRDDLDVGGKADVDGDVKGAGISLAKHVHPGVQSGPAKTLAPLALP
ncbi:MAG TPA: phage baseplate assembly protein V [Sphingomonas sp.]|jgi:phage baseplate assembly protein V|uniref:phage baseplate assembly protein V n=1 Tax=Sphingomonas sp. TaxID=28214 RepID=UPI002ED81F03